MTGFDFPDNSKRFFTMLAAVLAALGAVFVASLAFEIRQSLFSAAVQRNEATARLAARAVDERFGGLVAYAESFARRASFAAAVEAGDAAKAQLLLKELVEGSAGFSRAFFADAAGVERYDYPEDPSVIGRDFSDRDWYRGVSRGHSYVSAVYKRAASPRGYMVAVASPVRSASGETLGYLVAQHSLESLSGWFATVQPGRSSALMLVDHEGRWAAGSSGTGTAASLAREAFLRQALASRREGHAEAEHPVTGEKSLFGWAPVRSTGWLVLSSQPIAVVFSPMNRLQFTLTVLSCGFFGGVLFFLSYFLWFSAIRQYYGMRARAEKAQLDLAAVVEHSEDAIYGKTLDGVITSWNKGAERIYGYTPEEAIGKNVSFLMPAGKEDERKGILSQLARGERVRGFETRRVRKDGEVIDVSLTISPILGPKGEPIGAATVARDVSERRLLEARQAEQSHALEAVNEQMARRERVMRSLLEDLRDANKRLESLNRMKDEFVANASHELRTPLTAIREGISLLNDRVLGPLNDEQSEFLEAVDENIDRLTELINNVLDLSKIEAGRLAMNRRPVDVGALIRKLIESNRKLAGRRRLTLELHEAPPVYADANRLSQVLWNLLSNAVKFTKDAGVVAFKLESKGDRVEVSVRDDGIGIAKEDMDKLFQRFSQVGKKFYRGTGLGLALCKQIVELHGGEISAQSEPGRGTTFRFTLPVCKPELSPAGAAP